MKHIASVSMGKDSVAMLWVILHHRNEYPLDEVIFYDTGMEFQETYLIRDKVKILCSEFNIKYTELHPRESFLYKMLYYKHKTRKDETKVGYGWCGGCCRWGTTEKVRTIDKYCKDAIQYIGIAYDEKERYERLSKNKISPLYDYKLTEKDCMGIALSMGMLNPLYIYLKRVSCWCCRNKNLKELKAYKQFLPKYYYMLIELEKEIGEPMKPPYTLTERLGD